MSVEVDITTYSDADFNLAQTLLTAMPTDTTSKLHMQSRQSATDANVYLNLTSDAGQLTIVDTTHVTISVPQSMLQFLPPGVYTYSLICTSNGGAVRTEVFRGVHTHNAGPTQFNANTA